MHKILPIYFELEGIQVLRIRMKEQVGRRRECERYKTKYKARKVSV